jgi:hypothetical protein
LYRLIEKQTAALAISRVGSVFTPGDSKMKNTKWFEVAIPVAIFIAPIILITVTFYNTGRL